MEFKNFRHVGIVTEDFNSSLNFYKKIFGLKVAKIQIETHPSLAKIMGLNRVKIKTVKLKYNNKIILELLNWIFPKVKKNFVKKINSTGITHFAITVKNIHNIVKNLRKQKNCKVSKPELSADKKVKYTFCQTPEKVFIEIVEVLKK